MAQVACTPGSLTCDCAAGYELMFDVGFYNTTENAEDPPLEYVDRFCVDVNECDPGYNGSMECDLSRTTCRNTAGSYEVWADATSLLPRPSTQPPAPLVFFSCLIGLASLPSRASRREGPPLVGALVPIPGGTSACLWRRASGPLASGPLVADKDGFAGLRRVLSCSVLVVRPIHPPHGCRRVGARWR